MYIYIYVCVLKEGEGGIRVYICIYSERHNAKEERWVVYIYVYIVKDTMQKKNVGLGKALYL